MFEFTQFYNQKMEQTNPFLVANSQNKIKLSKNNVRLQFYFSNNSQRGYKLSFIVHLITPTMPQQIRASQVDDISLKKAILENVDAFDLKYMDLGFYSTNKAEFYFNYKKWLNDALRDFDIHKEFSIFNRKIKFKIPLPKMIMYDSLRNGFVEFITAKMKEEIIARKMDEKKFLPFLPKDFQKYLGQKTSNLFDYEYDIQYNILYVRLKSAFVITASLLLAKTISSSEISKTELKDPKFFDASVKKMLTDKNFDMKINKKS